MPTYYPSHTDGAKHAAWLAENGNDADAPSSVGSAKRKTSEARLAANRANAARSTGPRTLEGKARCAMNAFRHGLTGQVSALIDEDRAARDLFCAPLVDDLRPEGALEHQLAQSIAEGHWRLNRIRATEDNIYALGHYGPAADIEVHHPELHAALTSARVFLETSREMERLTLYEQRIHRGIEKQMRELEALQTRRRAEREKSLAEAAALVQVAEFQGEDAAGELEEIQPAWPRGSVISITEVRRAIRRKARLKAAAHLERRNWNPAIHNPVPA